jgi:hypothetical protein
MPPNLAHDNPKLLVWQRCPQVAQRFCLIRVGQTADLTVKIIDCNDRRALAVLFLILRLRQATKFCN